MSETAATQILQFWSALARGQSHSHQQALQAFQQQLAAFASTANVEQSTASAEALLESFKAFAPGARRPQPGAFDDATATECARFAGAAAQLQARLAEAAAVTVAEVNAQNAVRAPDSLQELFTRWVERYEQHLFELMTEPSFGVAFGDAVNAALECYRDTVGGDARSSVGQSRAVAALQHDVAALAARVADLEARQQ